MIPKTNLCKRKYFRFSGSICSLLGCSGNEKIIETEKYKQIKNILILFPEDMGNHMSSLGTSGISTPELDALASEGIYKPESRLLNLYQYYNEIGIRKVNPNL